MRKISGVIAVGAAFWFVVFPVLAAPATPAGLLRREIFQQKLAAVRDQKKQAILSRLDEKMNRINTKRTEHWEKVLQRLINILDRVETRAKAAQEEGKEITAVTSAITRARAAIVTAQAVVKTQREKDYTVEIGSENVLRTTVGQAIKSEQADLQTTRQAVDDARKAVALAVRALAKVRGESLTATPSAY